MRQMTIVAILLNVFIMNHNSGFIIEIDTCSYYSYRGGEPGGTEGAIAPPFCKVGGGRAPPLFTMFNRLLLINNTL